MLTKIKPFILAQIRDRKIGDSGQSANNKLPVELLVEIFLYCLSTDRFPIPSRAEAPILLGRVCRAWRSVSLNTPQLWAQITLSSSHPLDIWKSETFHRIGIREWIRRSGNSTLSFEIGVHPEEHISAPFLTLVLQAEAHRWKGVRLGTNCDCIDHILDMLCIQGKTPMLTDIRFLNKYALKKRHPRITCAPQVNTMYFRSADTLILGSGEFQALREAMSNARNPRDPIIPHALYSTWHDAGAYLATFAHLHC
ncbi:hypothetical protein BD410DRAFT_788510 [Rickenella mellea]|uniref:F-box domain-containing protein n=1 Tax=Rickenella mellea TaxID=50990 RepID=A0A4Y7Q6A4_9AGAM|nr:hypothetical protein BD410DRAFT_788510 [Rickenella mellea]